MNIQRTSPLDSFGLLELVYVNELGSIYNLCYFQDHLRLVFRENLVVCNSLNNESVSAFQGWRQLTNLHSLTFSFSQKEDFFFLSNRSVIKNFCRPSRKLFAMENFQKQMQGLLERMSCLEECNRLKDEEINRLQTDVRNVYTRFCACGNESIGSISSSTYTSSHADMRSMRSTVSATMDSYHPNGNSRENVTIQPDALKHMKERMTRLEEMVRQLLMCSKAMLLML